MGFRPEVPGDRSAVRELHLTAFAGHGPVVADLVDALHERLTPTTGLSLVAEDAGWVVGHVMFTRGRRRAGVPHAVPAHPRRRLPGPALHSHEPWMSGALVYPDTFWEHDAVGLRDPEA